MRPAGLSLFKIMRPCVNHASETQEAQVKKSLRTWGVAGELSDIQFPMMKEQCVSMLMISIIW